MEVYETLTLNELIRNIYVGAGGLTFVKIANGSLKPFGKKRDGHDEAHTVGEFIKRTEKEIREQGHGFLMGTLYRTIDQETTTEVTAINVVNGSFDGGEKQDGK